MANLPRPACGGPSLAKGKRGSTRPAWMPLVGVVVGIVAGTLTIGGVKGQLITGPARAPAPRAPDKPQPAPSQPPGVVNASVAQQFLAQALVSSGQRFHFPIAPGLPLDKLLPAPPQDRPQPQPLLGDDLATVPEVQFQQPFDRNLPPQKALEQTAHTIAKINHLNGKKTDGFLEALLGKRPDLAGLPFAMGDACRTTGEQSRQFSLALATIRQVLRSQGVAMVPRTVTRTVARPVESPPPPPPPVLQPSQPPAAGPQPSPPLPVAPPVNRPATPPLPVVASPPQPPGDRLMVFTEVVQELLPGTTLTADRDPRAFWALYRETCAKEDNAAPRRDRANRDRVTRARIAALMQVLMPEPAGMRVGLVHYLAGQSHVDATRALARLALFAAEREVREAALEALKVRRERDYTDILLEGFRYPLPAVNRRAGEALVALERSDLLPRLVDLLEEPDPRAPVAREAGSKKEQVVRELVRINHHRSCLLCHAPGNMSNVSPEAVTAQVPVPGEPLPTPSQGYNNSIPDVLVRVDVTYLRQDFSVLLPVPDANPWPEMQRFDFLVRQRVLTEAEARTYRDKLKQDGPGRVAPHQRAVLAALRELTGRDAAPTAQAWRELLNLSPRRPGA